MTNPTICPGKAKIDNGMQSYQSSKIRSVVVINRYRPHALIKERSKDWVEYIQNDEEVSYQPNTWFLQLSFVTCETVHRNIVTLTLFIQCCCHQQQFKIQEKKRSRRVRAGSTVLPFTFETHDFFFKFITLLLLPPAAIKNSWKKNPHNPPYKVITIQSFFFQLETQYIIRKFSSKLFLKTQNCAFFKKVKKSVFKYKKCVALKQGPYLFTFQWNHNNTHDEVKCELQKTLYET